ncbi:hypothetical protein DUNSADRAFT_3205 [Dunaliella salina]|uniref:Uncharacterized protein n=1 Tax=Dunaliella salina TaxID=3046 RepID=A0ABQ7GUC9_DUNSA|nr:hypothetical protein DUNSADRAFT_3205 [Dunaliella salina]|eukprot:KAF5838225.1 hypothetical protein DUNSADRAFT_3205 [Dunaliella salina]
MEKQVQAAELAMHMQQQAELKRALATTDSALSKCKADVAQLTGRASHLAQQLQQAHERAGKLETAADAAKERAVHAQQQAREAEAQQETYQQECDALREQAELAQKQAAAGFACGVQQASASAAALVKALRDKYFQASLIASPSSWHVHHDHRQQQQQQQVGSATTEACAEQNISKGAVVSPGGDGRRAQGVLALHSNMGRVAGGIGSAQHGDSLGQGPPWLQASHSLVASAAYEDAFGLKLCRLSHEGLMGAFQEYSKRQGQLDIAALIQQHHDHQHSHGQPHHDHQHHSRQHSRGQPHHAFLAASTTSISAAKAMSQQEPLPEGAWAERGAANSSRCAAACGAADSSTIAEWGADVCLELLWLEGCLLLALVEGRQAQQQQQQQQQKQQQGLRLKERGAANAGWEEDAGQEGVEGEKRVLQASAEGGTHKQGVLEGNAAKELVGQMMRAMARDRKLLQQRVHQLEAQASPHSSRIPTTHAHSLTTSPTSLPARRVLSAQPSAPLMPSSVLQHQPRMHSASAATGRKSIAAALATAAGAPLAAAVAAAPGRQQLLQQQQQQQQQVALDGHAHMQAAHHGLLVAPSNGSAGGQGLTALGQMGVRSSGQGSTEPASPSSSATPAPAPAPAAASSHLGASGNRGADQLNKADYDDDVWNVLEALEESSLRSSRGLHGLRSASGRGGMHGGSHCVGRGGLEGVMAGKRGLESRGSGRGPRGTGFLTPGPGQALGFQPRAQLSPGQAFVAKYREAGSGERGRT